MPLSEIIIQKIQQSGAIPFRDFMEMALYYPEHGYYASAKAMIGKSGITAQAKSHPCFRGNAGQAEGLMNELLTGRKRIKEKHI